MPSEKLSSHKVLAMCYSCKKFCLQAVYTCMFIANKTSFYRGTVYFKCNNTRLNCHSGMHGNHENQVDFTRIFFLKLT